MALSVKRVAHKDELRSPEPKWKARYSGTPAILAVVSQGAETDRSPQVDGPETLYTWQGSRPVSQRSWKVPGDNTETEPTQAPGVQDTMYTHTLEHTNTSKAKQ